MDSKQKSENSITGNCLVGYMSLDSASNSDVTSCQRHGPTCQIKTVDSYISRFYTDINGLPLCLVTPQHANNLQKSNVIALKLKEDHTKSGITPEKKCPLYKTITSTFLSKLKSDASIRYKSAVSADPKMSNNAASAMHN